MPDQRLQAGDRSMVNGLGKYEMHTQMYVHSSHGLYDELQMRARSFIHFREGPPYIFPLY